MFSALRGYPDEPIERANWAGTVKGKTERGILHAQGRRGKVRYRHDRFRLRFMQRQRNGEEPNDKPRKDTSINTRSVNFAWGIVARDDLVERGSL